MNDSGGSRSHEYPPVLSGQTEFVGRLSEFEIRAEIYRNFEATNGDSVSMLTHVSQGSQWQNSSA